MGIHHLPSKALIDAEAGDSTLRHRGIVCGVACLLAAVFSVIALIANVGTVQTVVNGAHVDAWVTLWKICSRTNLCEGGQCRMIEQCADPGEFDCEAEAHHYHAARGLIIVTAIVLFCLIVVGVLDAFRQTPYMVCESFQLRKMFAVVCGIAGIASFVSFAVVMATWYSEHCGPSASDIDGARVGAAPFMLLLASITCVAAGICALVLRTRLEKAELRQREERAAQQAGRRAEVQLDYLGNVAPSPGAESRGTLELRTPAEHGAEAEPENDVRQGEPAEQQSAPPPLSETRPSGDGAYGKQQLY
jgi:hypothetical protein